MSKEFIVEFNDEELGECRIYQENLMGYNQAIKDMKMYKAKQAKRITDLETELTDAEEHIDNLELQLREQYQLVDEKDEEIEIVKNMKADEMALKVIQKSNQDKIEFAIEQLEKVKNGIESKVESIYKRLDDLNIKIVCESTSRQLDTYDEIENFIDNQINELKEGK